MYKRFVGVLYVLNIVFQAFITLVCPIGLGILVSWLLVKYLTLSPWIYAPFVLLGVASGFYSMIRFVLSAMAAYERLEKEQNSKAEKK